MSNALYLVSSFLLIFIAAFFRLLYFTTTELTLKVYIKELAFPVMLSWAIYLISSDFVIELIKNGLKIEKVDQRFKEIALPILTGSFAPDTVSRLLNKKE